MQEPKQRTAEDYAKALEGISAILDAADLVLSFIPGGSTPKAVAKLATHLPKVKAAVDAAPAMLEKASPLIDKVGAVAPDAARKAASAVTSAAGGAGKAVGDAVSAQADAIAQTFRDAADAREEERARREARKLIFDSAGVSQSAETFLKNWAAHNVPGKAAPLKYLGYSGCYVTVVTEGVVKESDFGRMKNVFVGQSVDLGAAIYADFIGLGNVDVYADVKYKQHVYVLLYPCAEADMEKLHDSLIVALDADKSYNAPKTGLQACIVEAETDLGAGRVSDAVES